MLEDAAGWIAPVATMAAAVMTAANLGARVTGWGFVVFLFGSLAWCVVGLTTSQQNLLLTNGFLTLVNAVGVWRWLGRRARYEKGGVTAAARSASARVPDLFALGSLAGARLTDPEGEPIGSIVEGMMQCAGAQLAYIVVSEGGLAGAGERLHAIDPRRLHFTDQGVRSDLTAEELRALPVLEENWPLALDAATGRAVAAS